MADTITNVDHKNRQETDGSYNEEENALPVIMELRAVPVSPAGVLFDHYPMDSREQKRLGFFRRNLLFILLFILPTALSITYFGFIASDLYVTEAKYLVRAASSSDSGAISALVQSQGLSRAVDEAYVVNEYMVSRTIVPLLDRDHELRKILDRPEADFISRFPNFFSRNDSESLFKQFNKTVSIEADSTTGISTLEVRTFRPEDSLALAENILAQGEAFINELNVRANDDALQLAETIRDEAAAKLRDVSKKLTIYRNTELIIDPKSEAKAAIEMLGKISAELAVQEAKLSEQRALAPNNPAINAQKERVNAINKQYIKTKELLVGSDSSLANKLSGYETLALQQELAERSLATALVGIEKARQDAKSRRIYLQNVVAPRLSDYPTRPLRLMWIALTIGFSLCIYGIAKTYRDTVLEHQA